MKKLVIWMIPILMVACSNAIEISPISIPSSSQATIHPPSATVRPTITKFPTWTPTWTHLPPLPILSPERAEATVIELLQSNGGCQYPCWWGITPGETPWNVAINFLEPLSLEIIDFSKPNLDQNNSFFLKFSLPQNVNNNGFLNLNIDVHKDIVEKIYVYIDIQFHGIMNEFGQPNEIWITTHQYADDTRIIEYILVIFYKDKGIIFMVHDRGSFTSDSGEFNISICPNNKTKYRQTRILFWDPDQDLDFFEAARQWLYGANGELISEYYPLESVSSIGIDEFYATYQSAINVGCFLSPYDSWP